MNKPLQYSTEITDLFATFRDGYELHRDHKEYCEERHLKTVVQLADMIMHSELMADEFIQAYTITALMNIKSM